MSAEAISSPGPRVSWGPMQVLIGAGLAGAAFLLSIILVVVVIALVGSEPVLEDAGGPFTDAAEVARYADERLRAAVEGVSLPDPPELFADKTSMQIAFGITLVYQGGLILIAVAMSRQSPAALARTLGLGSYRFEDLWRPAVVTIAALLMVLGWSTMANAFDIEILKPKSTVPDAITRDATTFAAAGVLACIGAPIAEEVFFRGFVMSGLARWGVWVAAVVSAFAFSIAHLDPGSVVPFFMIGLGLSWLYWRRRCLWDAIACHFMFNFISFALLALGA